MEKKITMFWYIYKYTRGNKLGSKCDIKTKVTLHIRQRGGVVVERRTPNREVLGSIPTCVTVLYP